MNGRTSHIKNLSPEEDINFALFDVEVSDPDGPADIAAVEMKISGIDKTDSLLETSQAGVYNWKLFGDELPNGGLHSILGREILFTVSDRLGKKSEPQKFILFRIIDQTPEIVSPKERASADSTRPLLKWNSFSAAFAFTYGARVEKIVAGIPALAWEKSNVESILTSVRVDKILAKGEYRWTLSVTDEFGNTSTSAPVAFLVR